MPFPYGSVMEEALTNRSEEGNFYCVKVTTEGVYYGAENEDKTPLL